jgi:hypothetical protein
MLFVARPDYGVKRTLVPCSFQKEAWALWEQYCQANALHPLARLSEVMESAMVDEVPTLKPYLHAKGGRQADTAGRPPLVPYIKR